MVILQKSAQHRQAFNIPSHSALNNSVLDQDLSFMSGVRAGLSNDATAMMGLTNIGGGDLEDDSNESLLNSHRRSRS